MTPPKPVREGKIKLIPAWLFFALYEGLSPQNKWNDDKDKLARIIIKKLSTHLKLHCIENTIITEGNPYDDVKGYYAPIKNQ